MKKFFGPAWLGASLIGILPDSVFSLGKKTPWYRRSWLRTVPWLAAALVAPLAIFLVWKGVSLLLARGGQDAQTSSGETSVTELT